MRDSNHRGNDKTYVYRRPGADAPPRAASSAHEGKERRQETGQAAPYVAAQPARPGAPSQRGAPGKKRMSRKLRMNLLIGALVVILVVCIVLVAVLPGCRQSGFAAAAPENSAAGVSSGPGFSWGGQHTGAVLPETPDAGDEYVQETLFLGDSNTKRLMEYSSVTGLGLNTCIGVEGMGIQGASTSAIVRFEGDTRYYTMVGAVPVLKPRRVVVTFGTNNVGGYSAELFLESYEAVLEEISGVYPYADIIIGAVPPVDRYCSYGHLEKEIISEYNGGLKKLADKLGCRFLDWNEVLMDENGFARAEYTVDDGVHISEKGAEAMIRYFRTHSHITEDARPQPLGYVPRRLPITKQPAAAVGGGTGGAAGGGTGGGIPAPTSSPQPDSQPQPKQNPASAPVSVPEESAPAPDVQPAPADSAAGGDAGAGEDSG